MTFKLNEYMKTIVIYHAGCYDGWCSAWLFHLAFPNAEFIPAQYGEDPPDVVGSRIYVADFSYKRDVMSQIIDQAHSVCVLDHHATSKEELKNFPSCTEAEFESPNGRLCIVFDMTKSGGRLAWEHLYGQQLLPEHLLATNRSGYSLGVAPWLVDITEDRDLWKWALPDSREINTAIRSRPMTFQEWDYLHEHGQRSAGWNELRAEGSAILRSERQIVDQHVRNAREIEIDGHRVLSVNATVLMSEIGNELAKGRPFGATYFIREDGARVWSLRSSDDGLDVSEIARRHEGGGHRNASGYIEGA